MSPRLSLAVVVVLASGCGVASAPLGISSPASSARIEASTPAPDCRSPIGCPAQWYPAGLAFDVDRQTLVLFGGYRIAPPAADIRDTWEWNSAAGWTLRRPATIPPARIGTTMAYDQARHLVVMFGGRGTVGGTIACGTVGAEICSADTWTWNGTDWTQLHPEKNPQPFVPTMTYDQSSGAVVLYSISAETWSWDGASWTLKASLSGSPTPGHATPVLAFDPATGHVVLFGGFSQGGNVNSMWSWTGQSWTSLGADAPLANLESSAAENVDGKTLLGYQNPQVVPPAPPVVNVTAAQTWVWNGSRWTQLNPRHEPTAAAMGLFADPKSHRVLLVGTNVLRGNAMEIWAWDGADWSQLD